MAPAATVGVAVGVTGRGWAEATVVVAALLLPPVLVADGAVTPPPAAAVAVAGGPARFCPAATTRVSALRHALAAATAAARTCRGRRRRYCRPHRRNGRL